MHPRIITLASAVLLIPALAFAATKETAPALDMKKGEALIALSGRLQSYTAVVRSQKEGYFVLVPGRRYGPYEKIGTEYFTDRSNNQEYPVATQPPVYVAREKGGKSWLVGAAGCLGPFDSVESHSPDSTGLARWSYAVRDGEGCRLLAFDGAWSERRLARPGVELSGFRFSPDGAHFSALCWNLATKKVDALLIDDLLLPIGAKGCSRIGWVGAKPRLYFCLNSDDIAKENRIWYMLRYDPETGKLGRLVESRLESGLDGAFDEVSPEEALAPKEAALYVFARSQAKQKGLDTDPIAILKALYGNDATPLRFSLLAWFSDEPISLAAGREAINVVTGRLGWVLAENRAWGPFSPSSSQDFCNGTYLRFSPDLSAYSWIEKAEGGPARVFTGPAAGSPAYGPYEGSILWHRFLADGRLFYQVSPSKGPATFYADGRALDGAGKDRLMFWSGDAPADREYWASADEAGATWVWHVGKRVAGPFDSNGIVNILRRPDGALVCSHALGGRGIAYGPFGELRAPEGGGSMRYVGELPGGAGHVYLYQESGKGAKFYLAWGGAKLGPFEREPDVLLDPVSGAGFLLFAKGEGLFVASVSPKGKMLGPFDTGMKLPLVPDMRLYRFSLRAMPGSDPVAEYSYVPSGEFRSQPALQRRVLVDGALRIGDYDDAAGRLIYWDEKKKALVER